MDRSSTKSRAKGKRAWTPPHGIFGNDFNGSFYSGGFQAYSKRDISPPTASMRPMPAPHRPPLQTLRLLHQSESLDASRNMPNRQVDGVMLAVSKKIQVA